MASSDKLCSFLCLRFDLFCWIHFVVQCWGRAGLANCPELLFSHTHKLMSERSETERFAKKRISNIHRNLILHFLVIISK